MDLGIAGKHALAGTFGTDRLMKLLAAEAQHAGRSADELVALRAQQIPARRIGQPDEFGSLCAFICSVHAGYITGQNLPIDGGAYPGTF